MILKIMTDSGSVLLDGFNRLQHSPIDPRCGYGTENTLDLREKQKKNSDPTVGIEIEIFRDGIFLERVLTHSPVYLMNDGGETVERI